MESDLYNNRYHIESSNSDSECAKSHGEWSESIDGGNLHTYDEVL